MFLPVKKESVHKAKIRELSHLTVFQNVSGRGGEEETPISDVADWVERELTN